MARLYTIKFFYCETSYVAVVFEKNSIVTVNLYDKELHEVIPGGKFCIGDNYNSNYETVISSTAHQLKTIILAAMEKQQKGSIDIF